MAFDDVRLQTIRRAVRSFIDSRRPPEHLREHVDLGYRIEDQSVEIFEVRAAWNDPGTELEQPVAKATYVRSRDLWKVYWQRADLRWHVYQSVPEVATIEEFLAVVGADTDGCYFG